MGCTSSHFKYAKIYKELLSLSTDAKAKLEEQHTLSNNNKKNKHNINSNDMDDNKDRLSVFHSYQFLLHFFEKENNEHSSNGSAGSGNDKKRKGKKKSKRVAQIHIINSFLPQRCVHVLSHFFLLIQQQPEDTNHAMDRNHNTTTTTATNNNNNSNNNNESERYLSIFRILHSAYERHVHSTQQEKQSEKRKGKYNNKSEDDSDADCFIQYIIYTFLTSFFYLLTFFEATERVSLSFLSKAEHTFSFEKLFVSKKSGDAEKVEFGYNTSEVLLLFQQCYSAAAAAVVRRTQLYFDVSNRHFLSDNAKSNTTAGGGPTAVAVGSSLPSSSSSSSIGSTRGRRQQNNNNVNNANIANRSQNQKQSKQTTAFIYDFKRRNKELFSFLSKSMADTTTTTATTTKSTTSANKADENSEMLIRLFDAARWYCANTQSLSLYSPKNESRASVPLRRNDANHSNSNTNSNEAMPLFYFIEYAAFAFVAYDVYKMENGGATTANNTFTATNNNNNNKTNQSSNQKDGASHTTKAAVSARTKTKEEEEEEDEREERDREDKNYFCKDVLAELNEVNEILSFVSSQKVKHLPLEQLVGLQAAKKQNENVLFTFYQSLLSKSSSATNSDRAGIISEQDLLSTAFKRALKNEHFFSLVKSANDNNNDKNEMYGQLVQQALQQLEGVREKEDAINSETSDKKAIQNFDDFLLFLNVLSDLNELHGHVLQVEQTSAHGADEYNRSVARALNEGEVAALCNRVCTEVNTNNTATTTTAMHEGHHGSSDTSARSSLTTSVSAALQRRRCEASGSRAFQPQQHLPLRTIFLDGVAAPHDRDDNDDKNRHAHEQDWINSVKSNLYLHLSPRGATAPMMTLATSTGSDVPLSHLLDYVAHKSASLHQRGANLNNGGMEGISARTLGELALLVQSFSSHKSEEEQLMDFFVFSGGEGSVSVLQKNKDRCHGTALEQLVQRMCDAHYRTCCTSAKHEALYNTKENKEALYHISKAAFEAQYYADPRQESEKKDYIDGASYPHFLQNVASYIEVLYAFLQSSTTDSVGHGANDWAAVLHDNAVIDFATFAQMVALLSSADTTNDKPGAYQGLAELSEAALRAAFETMVHARGDAKLNSNDSAAAAAAISIFQFHQWLSSFRTELHCSGDHDNSEDRRLATLWREWDAMEREDGAAAAAEQRRKDFCLFLNSETFRYLLLLSKMSATGEEGSEEEKERAESALYNGSHFFFSCNKNVTDALSGMSARNYNDNNDNTNMSDDHSFPFRGGVADEERRTSWFAPFLFQPIQNKNVNFCHPSDSATKNNDAAMMTNNYVSYELENCVFLNEGYVRSYELKSVLRSHFSDLFQLIAARNKIKSHHTKMDKDTKNEAEAAEAAAAAPTVRPPAQYVDMMSIDGNNGNPTTNTIISNGAVIARDAKKKHRGELKVNTNPLDGLPPLRGHTDNDDHNNNNNTDRHNDDGQQTPQSFSASGTVDETEKYKAIPLEKDDVQTSVPMASDHGDSNAEVPNAEARRHVGLELSNDVHDAFFHSYLFHSINQVNEILGRRDLLMPHGSGAMNVDGSTTSNTTVAAYNEIHVSDIRFVLQYIMTYESVYFVLFYKIRSEARLRLRAQQRGHTGDSAADGNTSSSSNSKDNNNHSSKNNTDEFAFNLVDCSRDEVFLNSVASALVTALPPHPFLRRQNQNSSGAPQQEERIRTTIHNAVKQFVQTGLADEEANNTVAASAHSSADPTPGIFAAATVDAICHRVACYFVRPTFAAAEGARQQYEKENLCYAGGDESGERGGGHCDADSTHESVGGEEQSKETTRSRGVISAAVQGAYRLDDHFVYQNKVWAQFRAHFPRSGTREDREARQRLFDQYLYLQEANSKTDVFSLLVEGTETSAARGSDNHISKNKNNNSNKYNNKASEQNNMYAYLTIGDLEKGAADVLHLDTFFKSYQKNTDNETLLGPILWRAFIATKELTFYSTNPSSATTQNNIDNNNNNNNNTTGTAMHLTKSSERVLAAEEFFCYINYLYDYTQLYIMFDYMLYAQQAGERATTENEEETGEGSTLYNSEHNNDNNNRDETGKGQWRSDEVDCKVSSTTNSAYQKSTTGGASASPLYLFFPFASSEMLYGKKEVRHAQLPIVESLLRFWGISLQTHRPNDYFRSAADNVFSPNQNNFCAESLSITRFTEFAMWASERHLCAEGYHNYLHYYFHPSARAAVSEREMNVLLSTRLH